MRMRHTWSFLTILFPGESEKSEPLNAVVLVLVTVLDGIVESLTSFGTMTDDG